MFVLYKLANLNQIKTKFRQICKTLFQGNFGTFAGQRMNFPNLKCFEPSPSNCSIEGQHDASLNLPSGTNETMTFEQARNWISLDIDNFVSIINFVILGKATGGGLLHLSPMEALYLVFNLIIYIFNLIFLFLVS